MASRLRCTQDRAPGTWAQPGHTCTFSSREQRRHRCDGVTQGEQVWISYTLGFRHCTGNSNDPGRVEFIGSYDCERIRTEVALGTAGFWDQKKSHVYSFPTTFSSALFLWWSHSFSNCQEMEASAQITLGLGHPG